MRLLSMALVGLWIGTATAVAAQAAPPVVWEVLTPSGLANQVGALAWAPDGSSLAIGSSDRWLRLRGASDGAQRWAVLEPHRSKGVSCVLYSVDGAFVGVQNASSTLGFRVQRSSDGAFLGSIVGTVRPNGLVSFAPDAALLASVGGDGTMGLWLLSDLTVSRTTGSGYDKVTTVFNFSPDGRFQTAASKGVITVQRRTDGSILAILKGGPALTFSPRSNLLAAASAAGEPSAISLYGTTRWTLLKTLRTPEQVDGVAALRFSPDSARVVATGYLPFVDADGLWQQAGIIRIWRVSEGLLLQTYDQRTSLAVTSPIAWSPDGMRFAYGLYNGTVAVAQTPR
jgi:WD40 repeat protein